MRKELDHADYKATAEMKDWLPLTKRAKQRFVSAGAAWSAVSEAAVRSWSLMRYHDDKRV